MARPIKENAEYFPHDKDMRDDPKIKAIRQKFGLEGYAVWSMLLESLCDADGFEIEFSDDLSKEVLAGDIGIDSSRLDAIVTYMVKLKLLNLENGRISSESFKKRMEPLLEKRNRERAYRDSRSGVSNAENRVSNADNGVSNAENRVNNVVNTQSKVKESKVKESKEERESNARESFSEKSDSTPPEAGNELSSQTGENSQGLQKGGGGEAALPPERRVRRWAAQNLELLKQWAVEVGYDHETHGSVSDEVSKFALHYESTTREQQRTAFLSDPEGFAAKHLKGWLLKAKDFNRAKKGGKTDAKATKPPEDVRGAFSQRFGAMSEKLTQSDLKRLGSAPDEQTFWYWAEAIYKRLKGGETRTGTVTLGAITNQILGQA